MSGKPRKIGKPCRSPQEGKGGNTQVYLHSVTDAQAALLTESKCQEIKQKTGADVQFDTNGSGVQNTKIVIIRGSSSQIKAAVSSIIQVTGTQETISAQAETFWQQSVEAVFPDLDSRAYFLPPVYFNRVPMTRQSTAGQDVLVLHEAPGQSAQSTPGQSGQSTPGQAGQSTLGQAGQSTSGQAGQSTPLQAGQSNQLATNLSAGGKRTQPPNVQDSDVRDDAAMQRVFICLQKMSEKNREVLVGLSQLQFGQYLGEPCYAAAAAHLPVAGSLPAALSKHKQGDFDVLLIHRQYGIVVFEVKAFGDNLDKRNMSQQDIDKNIRTKLRKAVLQLDKAQAMLSHLVSDVTPGLHIIKTIVVPNLRARQVQQAISGDSKLMQDLCRCLGTTDPADITGLCVCSDQLSDPKTPWDVSSDVLRELGNWWQRRVAVSGPDSHMTCDNYKRLVARFCGPATTVTVPCTSPPRLCVKTLGQAVSCTGECYTAQITLFPEQVHLLNTAHPRVLMCGPPGTGKTVVLLLKATEWMRCGDDVYIVSTSWESCAACSMLYHLLLQIVNTQLTSVVSHGQPHLLQYDFTKGDLEQAIHDLSLAAKRGSLHVIADQVDIRSDVIKNFCDKLLSKHSRLHLWGADCYHGDPPAGWHVINVTRPLRCSPAVAREVQQDLGITLFHDVKPYSERGVADHTDGLPVRRLYHQGQGHSGQGPHDCVTCGLEVASFLHSLRFPVDSTTSTTVCNMKHSKTPPCLQWRDVLVLFDRPNPDSDQGVVTGLREGDIPIRVMKHDDIEDVATARSDVVWVARGVCVQGLERKVVICVNDVENSPLSALRLYLMSRCTSQLVIVSRPHHRKPPPQRRSYFHTCHLL